MRLTGNGSLTVAARVGAATVRERLAAPNLAVKELRDHQRPHHVVLFVFQDVAVPHVFVTTCTRARWGRNGEAARGLDGGKVELHDDPRNFTRVHFYGFLPAKLFR